MGNNFSNNEEDGPTEGNNCFLLCNNLSMTFAKKVFFFNIKKSIFFHVILSYQLSLY